MYVFLYPESYLRLKHIDEAYVEEAKALQDSGHKTLTFNSETYLEDDFSIISGSTVIYRGWMLTLEEYAKLEKRLSEFNVKMLTSSEQYKAAHYLPEWVDKLEGLTPKSHSFKNVKAAREYVIHHDKQEFFVKDFVKSLKTETKSFIHDIEQLDTWISEVEFFKGYIEGGICLREVEQFKEETELRFFVVNGVIFNNGMKIPRIVLDVVDRIDLPFYSVDVVKNQDDEWRVVEIGDGQVSSSETWKLDSFSKIFRALDK